MSALLNALVPVDGIRVTIPFALCALLVIAGSPSFSAASGGRSELHLRAMHSQGPRRRASPGLREPVDVYGRHAGQSCTAVARVGRFGRDVGQGGGGIWVF